MPNRPEARSAKAALTNATGRLPLLRLFSTPLIVRVLRLPSFLWKGFSTRYSSGCCAILPAQKAHDNEIPLPPLSVAQKDCKIDEAGGKSLRRSQ